MLKLKRMEASVMNEDSVESTDMFDFPEQDYSILSVRHTDEPKRVCDRCGKPITNIVRVKGRDGNVYFLGVNCAEIVDARGVEE